MRNIPFLIWMLGFPALGTLWSYIEYIKGIEVVGFAYLLGLAIYAITGFALYERPSITPDE